MILELKHSTISIQPLNPNIVQIWNNNMFRAIYIIFNFYFFLQQAKYMKEDRAKQKQSTQETLKKKMPL